METWAEYVKKLTGGESQDAVGEKVGVSGSTISRWRAGKRPGDPAEVAALAQAYGGDVLEAFIAAGYLTHAQAGLEDALERKIRDTQQRVKHAEAMLEQARHHLQQLEAERDSIPRASDYGLAADEGSIEPHDDE